MANTTFSTAWNASTSPRKQRKYRYRAPLHLRQKAVHAHLSKALRQKYPHRSVQVRKSDKVKIVRGAYAGKEGKVEQVLLKRERIRVSGAEYIRKDGSKVAVLLHPSNVVITELDLSDTLRRQKLESRPGPTSVPEEKKTAKTNEK